MSGPGVLAVAAVVAVIGGAVLMLVPMPRTDVPPEMSAAVPQEPGGTEAPAPVAAPAKTPTSPAPDAQAAMPEDGAGATGDPGAALSDPAADVPAPAFVVVRAEADGRVLVAGTAAPEHDVRIEVDRRSAASGVADNSGGVVMFFDLPHSKAPRVLELVATGPDGIERRSESSVVLAPRPVPEAPPSALATSGSEATRTADAAVSSLAEVSQPGGIIRENEATESSTAPPDVAAATPPVAQAPVNGEDAPNAAEGAVAERHVSPTRQVPGMRTEIARSEGGAPRAAPGPDAPTRDASPSTAAPAEPAASARSADSADPSDAVAAAERPDASGAGSSTAQRAPAVLLTDEQGVRLMQPPNRAQAADRVIVDVISYEDDGTVLLEGRGAPPPPAVDRVRVYLDNAPVQDAPIAEDGTWRLPLTDVSSGVYTLRVDQLDPAGNVVSRFETPFKREDPAELARFSAQSPAAEGQVKASVITVQPGYTLWGIADDRYGSGFEYVAIFEANDEQIRDPDLIYPGQVFDLPDLPDLPGGGE